MGLHAKIGSMFLIKRDGFDYQGKSYLYQSSIVHQIGHNLYRNENQQSTPILVSVNATWADIPSPWQRVMDILSRGVAQSKTDVRWSRVHRTENDTSAIPQTVSISQIQMAGYLNNRARELKIQEEICFSLVMKVIKIVMKLFWWYFFNLGGWRSRIIAFHEIDEKTETRSPSVDLNWRSSFKRNFDRSNFSPRIHRREISRCYLRGKFENNVSSKCTLVCYTCGDHNNLFKIVHESRSPSPRRVQFEKDDHRKTLDKYEYKCYILVQVHCRIGKICI